MTNEQAPRLDVLRAVYLFGLLPVIALITTHIQVEPGQRELDAMAYGLMVIGVGVLVVRSRLVRASFSGLDAQLGELATGAVAPQRAAFVAEAPDVGGFEL